MAMDVAVRGSVSGTGVEVAGTNQLKTISETDATANPANIGGARMFSEVDQGLATGEPYLLSPEVDDDYRIRVGLDTILDEEQLSTTAQNFTKHASYATTFAPTWSANGYNTNPASGVASGSGAMLRTYKTFSLMTTETVSVDMEVALTYASGVQPPANTVFEAGLALSAVTTPYDAFDGVYLRFNSSGSYLVLRNNSATDTSASGAFVSPSDGTTPWFPVSNRKYQYILYYMNRQIEVFISDPVTDLVWLAAVMSAPAGLGSMTSSPSLPFWLRQVLPSGASVASNMVLSRYGVRRGGSQVANSLGDVTTRALESNLSPGTLTTTANQSVTSGSITRPSAAVPTNTTAALLSQTLSGIALETPTLAQGTDGIMLSYQVPALPVTTGTTFPQARRLRIDGISLTSSVIVAFTGGPMTKQWYLAYGDNGTISLANVTADAAAAKAPRRVQLSFQQNYLATHGVGVSNSPSNTYHAFKNPIYVNPGEWVRLVSYNAGTVPSAGTIQHAIAFDYAWE